VKRQKQRLQDDEFDRSSQRGRTEKQLKNDLCGPAFEAFKAMHTVLSKKYDVGHTPEHTTFFDVLSADLAAAYKCHENVENYIALKMVNDGLQREVDAKKANKKSGQKKTSDFAHKLKEKVGGVLDDSMQATIKAKKNLLKKQEKEMKALKANQKKIAEELKQLAKQKENLAKEKAALSDSINTDNNNLLFRLRDLLQSREDLYAKYGEYDPLSGWERYWLAKNELKDIEKERLRLLGEKQAGELEVEALRNVSTPMFLGDWARLALFEYFLFDDGGDDAALEALRYRFEQMEGLLPVDIRFMKDETTPAFEEAS